jgi:beta-glucosidase
VPYADIPYSVVASEQNLALSAEAARDSLVLLKNDGVLPLAEGTKVAVIGPNADNELTLVANYFGYPTAPVTALEGVIAKAGAENVVYAPGAALAGNVFGNKKPVEASVFKHADEKGDLQPGLTMTSWDNASRDGDPVSVTVDAQIDHHWKTSPINGEIADEFVIVWTGFIVPETDGAYSFGVPRMSEATVDGKKITDGPIEMKAGKAYPVEYTLNAVRAWPVNTIEPTAKLSWVNTSRDWAGEALDVAKDADVVLFFGGIDADLEGEEMSVKIDGFLGGDRTNLKLPQVQEDLLKKLDATGKPVVLVNFSGSAVALNWEAENLPAIVQAFYPGEKAGTAIADLLWGDFSPSGRLPVTFYTSLDGMPDFDDYSMRNRTYKYYEGTPLYPFGYGLSYTSFAYSDIAVPDVHDSTQPMPVSVKVTNTGKRAGREVVQAYIQLGERPNPSTPRIELVAFDVVDLAPGESKVVAFDLSPERLGYFNDQGELVAPAGMTATVSLGGGQPGFAKKDGAASTTVTFNAD